MRPKLLLLKTINAQKTNVNGRTHIMLKLTIKEVIYKRLYNDNTKWSKLQDTPLGIKFSRRPQVQERALLGIRICLWKDTRKANFEIHELMNCFCGMFDWQKVFSLFPAWTIVRDSYHRKSPTRPEQDLNLCRTWVQASLIEVLQ